tara:strand:- start:62182 stop:62361 length:180 start_codon:yes stop_codon:yes gene_type:complete
MMDGNRKNMKMVSPLNNPVTPKGEFTILEDPVVTVKKSKIPADEADKNKANKKKIARYM